MTEIKMRTTARGFEPLRAEPNGFLVHHLNHSVTLSCQNCLCPNYAIFGSRCSRVRCFLKTHFAADPPQIHNGRRAVFVSVAIQQQGSYSVIWQHVPLLLFGCRSDTLAARRVARRKCTPPLEIAAANVVARRTGPIADHSRGPSTSISVTSQSRLCSPHIIVARQRLPNFMGLLR